MWIRSQDGKRLINSKNFCTNFNSVIAFTEEGLVNLGTYRTELKGMEVLDEIQNRVSLLEFNKIAVQDKENQSYSYSYEDFIYQMPKE